MKKINTSFFISGLLIGFLGVLLLLNRDFFTFGTYTTDLQIYYGLITLMGLVFLTGLSLFIIAFRFPTIRSYPAWFCLAAYVLCVIAGYIGLILLPAAKGNSNQLNTLLIIMIVMMILAIIAFYVSSGNLPKELRRAKNIKKSDFDTEEAIDMLDKFMKD